MSKYDYLLQMEVRTNQKMYVQGNCPNDGCLGQMHRLGDENILKQIQVFMRQMVRSFFEFQMLAEQGCLRYFFSHQAFFPKPDDLLL